MREQKIQEKELIHCFKIISYYILDPLTERKLWPLFVVFATLSDS